MKGSEPGSLVDVLRLRATEQPDKRAYTFLPEGEAQEACITYSELDQRARSIAASLQSMGASGKPALLLYPPGVDYIVAFLGCLYAGVIAVPTYPPRLNRSLARLHGIVADSQATLALTKSSVSLRPEIVFVESLGPKSPKLLATDEIDPQLADQWQEPDLGTGTLAFLQYTSGSTSAPKGVMVTHGNLLHNQRMIQNVFGQDEQSVIVGWLPLYHDMGLIGNVLQPLYIGASCILMSPVSFLQRPFRWLKAISSYSATTSGGPNFAYDLCSHKIAEDQLAELDLSSWRVAFNGSEPVRRETLDRFAARFGPCGFRREAFSPCYGLAEATLLVSGTPRAALPAVKSIDAKRLELNRVVESESIGEGDITLVSSGQPPADLKIVIAHPQSLTRCEPGEVGEIWISGQSIAKGYWDRPEQTEETFQARLADTGEGPFLRTGDLGFLHNGELFVTGRIKDLIIIRGLNHYPQDIEATVERCHTGLRPGGSAVFCVEDAGEEKLVVVQEVGRNKQIDLDAVIQSIRQAVAQEHEIQAHAVLLTKPHQIPKTSSGKVQRHACRSTFLEGSFDVLAQWRAADAQEGEATGSPTAPAQDAESITAWLKSRFAATLGVEPSSINATQPISRLGLDSLQVIQLTQDIETNIGLSLPMVTLMEGITVAELACEISAQMQTTRSAPSLSQPVGEESGDYPLTKGQEALWFLHQLAPESAAYNVAVSAEIPVGVDIASLRRAFQSLVNRHASLRTSFFAHQGKPVQRIHGQAGVHFVVEDASHLSDELFNARLVEIARRPFDLQQHPLMRVTMLTRAQQSHTLLIVVHHIISDYWSLTVLARELGILYEAEAFGAGGAALPPLTTRYTDHARQQTEMLAGPEGERLSAYWRNQLAGELPVLNLPTDRPRPASQTFRGAIEHLEIGDELAEKLKALARSNDATLYMVLLAAFQVLLHRYTGQKEILIGSPVSGRNRTELRQLVGYFVNVLALRAHFSKGPSFEAFLDQVRRTVLSAFEHQEYPFLRLVEEIESERDLSRSPIVQAMFVLQNLPQAHLSLGGLELGLLQLDTAASMFDLTMFVSQSGQRLTASLQYNTDLFDRATASRLLGHYAALLESAACDASLDVGRLGMLSDGELNQLLVEWNDTRRDYGEARCIHELFEHQVERTPEAVALVCGADRLSYRELNRRANRLAHRLMGMGAGPEQAVAVCLSRRAELVVSLLAVMKSGAAYVPLDPAYPPQRTGFILESCGAGLVITERSLLDNLPETSASLLCIDEVGEQDLWQGGDLSQGEANPHARVSASNLAYIIYTSGSTGQPKGVAIQHSSASLFLRWAADEFTADEMSGVLASTSVCFDLSVFEIFAPLTVGGKLILVDNALELGRSEARDEVRLINTVPSAMTELVRQGSLPETVVTVNLAGEALGRRLVEQIYGLEHVGRVMNLYGPSEDTTYTTYVEVKRGELGAVTIGRPVAQTSIYILDVRQEVVPIGVAGELYTSGEGLARCYEGRAEQTAERFVPDPYSGRAGAKMYRTGDLCRYRGDGEIDYLGRVDQQVKVRGYRIELGEVEAALVSHPMVKEAVVVVQEVREADKKLVAYVVSAGGEEVTASEMRKHLRERLPDYMVPTAFVKLDKLPMTPNGKVDRKALPAYKAESGAAASVGRQASEVEQVVAGIWKEVLGVEEVGIEENFFEVGGHSLLATQVMARVREAFGVEMELRRMFEAATVADLSLLIEKALQEDRGLLAPPIHRFPRDGDLPLSFSQQRLWFLDQLEPDSALYNIASAARLKGPLNIPVMVQSLSEITRRHEALRTIFKSDTGRPVQVFLPPAPLDVPLVDLSRLPEDQIEIELMRIATEEAQRPFTLSEGLLIRGTLVRLGELDHAALVTMHHIVSDGWSMGIFIRELAALYQAFSAGEPSPLPELPIQYADFAQWQHQWLQGEALEKQLSYWKEQLEGAPPLLEMPTDRPRPVMQTFRGQTQSLALSENLTRMLIELSQRENATLFMVMLAAFQALLFRYSHQQDIVIGTPIAGRRYVGTESLIGFFVNTLAMRAKLSAEITFRDLLKQVRETALAAYAHQDLPFEKLVEELVPGRDLSRSPIVQAMFVLQNLPQAHLSLGGLELGLLQLDTAASMFDLTMFVSQSGQRLTASLQYNTDLFDRATASRLLGHYAALLESAASDASLDVGRLGMLSDGELNQLLVEWNDTRRDYGEARCIHELFEHQVERTPDAIALRLGGEAVSYRELNQRANRLAYQLIEMGAGPEQAVAVCLSRRAELVVSLLAVMKSGAAYVPLDPAYPMQRTDYILRSSRAKLVITEHLLLDNLPETSASLLCIDEVGEQDLWQGGDLSQGEANPHARVSASNLAYIIYTSGSTGQPKGVAIQHSSASLFLRWAADEFTADEMSGVLASTSVCFDLSVFEIFAPLSVGGKLILVDNALELGRSEARDEVRLINTVPSAMTELVRQGSVPESVVTVNLAGEALGRRLVEQIYGLEHVGRVMNLYGPSEDTTYTTYVEVKRGEAGAVTIGRPVAQTSIYILDVRQEVVPIGVAGELYTSGEGLARCYEGRAEQTAERFVPDPYSGRAGARMYRTGDLCRYRGDGEIDYLGRVDQQVKVRGYRIELGEVEAALVSHPMVKEAVVVVREVREADKKLVAYVVSAGGEEVTASEMRRHLREKLPDYMVPTAFVKLDKLPMTPNGKVDRKALPAYKAESGAGATEGRQASEVEQVVAGIWKEVLGVEEVGIEENFFEVGGHSLLATQVMARVREAFGVEMELRRMFEAATVADLSLLIEKARNNGTKVKKKAITRVSRELYSVKVSPDGEITIPDKVKIR